MTIQAQGRKTQTDKTKKDITSVRVMAHTPNMDAIHLNY